MKRFSKSIAVLLIAAVSLTLLAGCSNSAKEDAIKRYGSDTMKLFLPGAYMSDDLVPNFEKEFGVKVIVELFDSNEMMYTKFMAGDTYDVIIPSDYMIEKLTRDNQLMALDKSLIPNLEKLADEVRNEPYDPDNTYSVPYFFGTVGIVYNKNNVPYELISKQGFDILKNTDYRGKIYMYDSERDGFMVPLKQLGYSCNSDDPTEIEAAYQWLIELNKTMDPIYITDEVIDYMSDGKKDMAIVYSGDAVTILSENEDMRYFTPDCGTNTWVDAMVIPANAENPKLAHEFINYCLSYDAAMSNTEYVGYASTNADVLKDVTSEGGIYEGNEAYYPRTYEKDEVFHDNDELRKKLSELWIKVKAAG